MPYIGNQPGTGVRNRFIYTATASQTTFTGADNNSKTLSYADSAYVDVFLNGICLVPGTDYTASTKTSIVLTQAASLSDTLEVIAYDVASMDDSLSTSDGGTILGNLGVSTSSPDLTFTNTTSEDTDGGRESTITFKGKQSGGEESTLAEIRASHDATADDQKGDLIFKTNDGSDGTSPTEAMRIESDQQVLITTSADAKGLTIKNSGDNRPYLNMDANRSGAGNNLSQINFKWDGTDVARIIAVAGAETTNKDDAHITFGTASAGSVDERMRLTSSGGLAIGSTDNNGFNLKVEGLTMLESGLSKGSGSFKIRHPLESKKDTHWLVHSFVEGPQADNLYRGRVTLEDGVASVNVDIASGMTDGTFVLLNRDIQCFTTNETGWTPIKGSVSGNILTITAQDNTCTDTISWMVIGERQDDHMKQNTTGWTDSDGKIIIEPELTKTEKEDNTEIIENPVLKFDYSELEAE